jgi:hypothetical protein
MKGTRRNRSTVANVLGGEGDARGEWKFALTLQHTIGGGKKKATDARRRDARKTV